MKRIVLVMMLLLSINLLGGCAKKDNSIKIMYPSVQEAFHNLNKSFPGQYESAINEIQKSSIFNSCNEARRKFAKENKLIIKDWIGEINRISTKQGGDIDSVKIVSKASGFKIAYETHPGSIVAINTILPKGSKVYNQLAQLETGQLVKFSAKFILDEKRGISEISVTEKGCVDFPYLEVYFDDIVPYLEIK